MSPADYVLLTDGVGASLCVAAGYGMLTLMPAKTTAIRGCFWAAGIGFGSLGVVWAVWGADPMQSLSVRLTVAGITGAIAATALAWVLWQIRDHTPVPENPTSTVPEGPGGRGGNATVEGKHSGAAGGTGGMGGIGPGGPGGDAAVKGDNSFARGGDGGNAGQPDGRGGPRTLSQGERLNLPTAIWPYGYGGRGANAPEYDRRRNLLKQIRAEFMKAFPDDVPFIEAGIDQVPISWVNKRLEELGEHWRVTMGEGGYVLPPLSNR
jgi:hypothetical protein